MVGFDHSRLTAYTTLHYIRINGSLHKEIHCSDFLGFLFKNADKLLTDNLTFVFRFFYSLQLLIEAFLGVYTDKVKIIMSFRSENSLYFISLVFTEKTMIYKYTGKLISNCF